MTDHEAGTVPPTPHHEAPSRPVPQATNSHRRDGGEHVARQSGATAAKRDVQIIADEVRQRDVPSPPECVGLCRRKNGINANGWFDFRRHLDL